MYTPRSTTDQLALFGCTEGDMGALRVTAFAVLDRMQQCKPSVQLLGTAVALRAMAESLGLNLSDLMQQASNVLRAADGPFGTHIQAIRDYAAGELRRA